MSIQVFFSFSTGLSRSLWVPKGTKDRLLKHMQKIEQALGITREQYLDNPVHWNTRTMEVEKVDDKLLCEWVEKHNSLIRETYQQFAEWSTNPVVGGEEITPEDAKEIWPGLEMMLEVPVHKWTADYYRARMEALYEVMRGRENEGMIFEEKPLTPKQAGAVVRLFEQFLDPESLDLEVPNNRDYLASGNDGEYQWCEKCGPVAEQDVDSCKKRKCPLRAVSWAIPNSSRNERNTQKENDHEKAN